MIKKEGSVKSTEPFIFRGNRISFYEEVITMINLTFKERIACNMLANLKHDGTNFVSCRFNDCLLNFVNGVLRVNPYKLFEKVIKYVDND